MSEIPFENDNDGAFAEKKTFFSGGLAQVMVFTNGLILTMAAYIVLSFYLTNVLENDVQTTKIKTEQSIVSNLHEMEQSIKTISTLVALNNNVISDEVRRQMYYAVKNPDIFDRIVFMYEGEDGWNINELHSNRLYQEAFMPPLQDKRFIKDMLTATNSFSQNHEMFLLTDYPGRADYNASIEPYVIASPIILGKMIDKNAAEKGVLIAISSSERILHSDWLAENNSLSHVVLRNAGGATQCLYMMKKNNASRFDCAVSDGEYQDVHVADKILQMRATASVGESGAVLAKIPMLMLVFGSLLTLLGTLYVRNNQRQAYRLAEINRKLAQKNYDLNTEVAERERLNYTLRKTEREYRATIDGVTDIIFEVSTDGDILFMNETWFRITGFKTGQVIGRPLFDLLQHNDHEEQKEMFGEMVRGQRHAYKTFTKLRTSDGSFRSVEMTFSMIRQDESGNLRVLGAFTDIEDRKRAEDALSEAEKKYRTIWENAAGGIYQVSTDGRFLTANPSLARIFEYDDTDQLIRQVRNAHEQLYVYPQERAKFLREMETIGFITNFETQAKTKSGGRIWISESARAVKDGQGNILYFEGSIEDITRRKEGEIKLREAKTQSDLANRAKSEFLANMSHELRTPLNAIIGFSEIIKKEVLGPVQPPEYAEYSNDIYESGKRLLKIINEILDVSRIETGNRNLNESRISVDRVMGACVEFMQPKADMTNISITNLVQHGAPDVIGEEIAIKQIILNLLSNAVKFTPEKGRITISYEVDREGQLRLSVSDTGVGIDDSQIEKALSPFGQVETSFNRTASGAGLGLTLVNSLIKLHGGSLELFSQKGLGTTATVIFPARRVSPADAKNKKSIDEVVEEQDAESSEALQAGDRRAAERRNDDDRRQREIDLRYLKDQKSRDTAIRNAETSSSDGSKDSLQ